MTPLWTEGALIAGGAIASSLSAYILLKEMVKSSQKRNFRKYKKQIEDLEKFNTMLKFSTVPKEEHKKIIKEETVNRETLQHHLEEVKKELSF